MFQLRLVIACLMVFALGFQSGCRSRIQCVDTACPSVISSPNVKPQSLAVAGVSNDYSLLGSHNHQPESPPTGQTHVLTLEETLCVAATNSQVARQLESQLRKLNQFTENVECPGALNLALSSQIVEERNRAASLAGQLFLGLVEVELQRELLVEAQQRLIEINKTISEADAEGFATADAKEMLESQSVEIAKRESELNFNAQKIQAQLKALLELNAEDRLEVSYHLSPSPLVQTLQDEKAKASQNRAELASLRQLVQTWDRCSSESAKAILSAADPRMGVELAKTLVKRCRWPLLKRRESEEDPCESQALREQTEELLRDSERAVLLRVEELYHETQFAYESIVLACDEIHRLEGQVSRISAKKELDATGAYIDLQRNWHDTLLARSRRITEAVKYESGQLRLAEATGELAAVCGFGFSFCNQNGL